ncbi:hypothetical protein GCM10023091_05830 [Ravibacter arvi]|uniref:Uncharacterized protein n=1 Tax=Ravibacter arvi TaxID=2051041 RepID=A0ABP8LPX7_9BACT
MTVFFRKPIWESVAGIGLALLMLFPLVHLGMHNHASAADDYCYIDTVFKYGWFGAMEANYTGWTGRYFGILLNHSNPLLFHWFAGFKWMPVLVYAGLLYAFYLLIRKLNPNPGVLVNTGLTSVLFFLFVLKIPSILEAFFWTAAVANYTVSIVFIILWLAVAIQYSTPTAAFAGGGSPWQRKIQLFLLFFFVFAINGGSENLVLVIMILISAWFGYELLFRRKFHRLSFFLLLWGIFTALLSFLSVGNNVRLEGNPHSKNFLFALVETLKFTPQLLKDWILSPSLLVFTLLWLFALPGFVKMKNGGFNPLFDVNPVYSMLVAIAVYASQIFPSYYGIGIFPSPRMINCAYLFFLLGWFYNLGVVYTFLAKNKIIAPERFPVFPFALKPVLLAVVLWHFANSANPRLMYRELRDGSAAEFDREMTARTDLMMHSTADTLYLQPLSVHPETLFLEDIKPDPKHLWNRCMAGYFGKKAIYLVETGPHATPK